MNIINDLPFYIVILTVFLNILVGIITKTDFTVLMVRSIVLTIAFSLLGFALSEALKKYVEQERKRKKEAAQKQENQGSTIDIQTPDIDESELLNYGREDRNPENEEFFEVNPAYLHKFGQEEQNE